MRALRPPDDLSHASTWAAAPTLPGIAHGWHGPAWVWLALVRAGLAPERRRTLVAVRERLRESSRSGNTSLFIGEAARPVVAALASQVDPGSREIAERAIAEWVATAPAERSPRDVMTGSAGALLAAGEIAVHLPGQLPPTFVAALHERCRRDLASALDAARTRRVYLGLAHGLAGSLLALEVGHRAFGQPAPAALRRRTLATLQRSAIRLRGHEGLFWPACSLGERLDGHGWCHGAPGIGLALAACFALSRRHVYRSLSRRALAATASLHIDHPSTCCGTVGRVQVLVEAARLLGEGRWLEDAHRLARRLGPVRAADRRLARGLWKGRGGFLFAAWRLASPEHVPFPGLGVLSAEARRVIA